MSYIHFTSPSKTFESLIISVKSYYRSIGKKLKQNMNMKLEAKNFLNCKKIRAEKRYLLKLIKEKISHFRKNKKNIINSKLLLYIFLKK